MIKCNRPECEVRCPVKHCEKGRCPKCETVCRDPICHTECANPEPKCEAVCENPVCDWRCHRPSNCPKPKCALICEKSPHCQQPEPQCCGCAAAETVAVVAVSTPKCCGCGASAGVAVVGSTSTGSGMVVVKSN